MRNQIGTNRASAGGDNGLSRGADASDDLTAGLRHRLAYKYRLVIIVVSDA